MTAGGGRRVLIVEDEGMVAMLVEGMLMDLGYEPVAIVGDLDKAMSIAASADFDLAVIDVNLNGRSSYPVAEILVERNIPFVFATGYGKQGLPPEWREVPVLQKPFPARELEDVIDRALAGRNR